MKKLLLGLVAIFSITTMAATKEGTGLGYKDDITVSVETEGDKITAIKVIKMAETKRIAEPAIEKLTAEIIAKQSVEVDKINAGQIWPALIHINCIYDDNYRI
mgnify:CR=1 FL=1